MLPSPDRIKPKFHYCGLILNPVKVEVLIPIHIAHWNVSKDLAKRRKIPDVWVPRAIETEFLEEIKTEGKFKIKKIGSLPIPVAEMIYSVRRELPQYSTMRTSLTKKYLSKFYDTIWCGKCMQENTLIKSGNSTSGFAIGCGGSASSWWEIGPVQTTKNYEHGCGLCGAASWSN